MSDAASKRKKVLTISTDETENNQAVNFIHYAISRDKSIEYILQYPITSRPIFLLEKDTVNLKKSNKAELCKSLIGIIDKSDIVVNEDGQFSYL